MSISNHQFCLRKIVSGGQTGVDRAALDVAIHLGIEHGGWCPRGRRAEDGKIPPQYQLRETDSRDYTDRTERNVVESDGTLILHRGKISRGTKLTREFAIKHGRPHHCVDLEQIVDQRSLESSSAATIDWINHENICVLNVAGPRESTSPEIAAQSGQWLVNALGHR